LSPGIFEILIEEDSHLINLNVRLISWFKNELKIETPMVRASELKASGAKGDLLSSLCSEVGATEYLSPPGSKTYLDECDSFQEKSIPIRYFQYDHPVYTQRFGEFLPYMSIVDLLFNCGPESASVINSGCA
jgi:hypothetical protein